jgi:proteasome lid subunit RPN8/RPN11
VILAIPKTLIESILSGAARAHPKECCGLIEGVCTDNGWRVAALHETKNVAPDGAREFLIDPEAHFRLLRAMRGTARAIIGCYHSHPDSLAKPSETDRASASEDGFLWLIAGRGDEIAAFVYRGEGKDFTPIRIERTRS